MVSFYQATHGLEMTIRHEREYDCRIAPIDPDVVYASGGEKPHGWDTSLYFFLVLLMQEGNTYFNLLC